MINIICLGKIKEKYLIDLIDDYAKRIHKYHKINIIELKDENDLDVECRNILKNINSKDYVIACTIEGNQLSSVELAKKLAASFINYPCIDFVIGSSEGMSDEVKKRANYQLSFSRFTMPHGLFRGVLLEQIYRSFKLNNNETYHK